MMRSMRTTVNIDDQLLEDAKVSAVRRGLSLSSLVDEGLRLLLNTQPAAPGSVSLPTFGGSGLQPGVDLEDKDGLTATMDEDSGARAAR